MATIFIIVAANSETIYYGSEKYKYREWHQVVQVFIRAVNSATIWSTRPRLAGLCRDIIHFSRVHLTFRGIWSFLLFLDVFEYKKCLETGGTTWHNVSVLYPPIQEEMRIRSNIALGPRAIFLRILISSWIGGYNTDIMY